MDEEERKKKKKRKKAKKKKRRKEKRTVSLGTAFASEGICLFVDLWKTQPCL